MQAAHAGSSPTLVRPGRTATNVEAPCGNSTPQWARSQAGPGRGLHRRLAVPGAGRLRPGLRRGLHRRCEPCISPPPRISWSAPAGKPDLSDDTSFSAIVGGRGCCSPGRAAAAGVPGRPGSRLSPLLPARRIMAAEPRPVGDARVAGGARTGTAEEGSFAVGLPDRNRPLECVHAWLSRSFSGRDVNAVSFFGGG